jgi:NADPH-dependent 7-cyano-7-deazaguanine reductase QueF
LMGTGAVDWGDLHVVYRAKKCCANPEPQDIN